MRYEYTVYDLRVDEVPSKEAAKCWMESTLRSINATVLGYLAKDFPNDEGNAYTQLWVLAESHAVIHTSPEEGWVEIVFAFCKNIERPPLTKAVKCFWHPEAMTVQTMTGVVPGRGWKKGPNAVNGLGEDWKHNPYEFEELVFRTKSPYQEIMITRIPDGEVALYLDGGIQFVSGHDDQVYHWSLATAPALMVGDPKNALILGGGDGLAARNLFEFPSVQKVTMVEIDPVMTNVCRQHPLMQALNKKSFDSPKMDLRIMDARKFIAQKPKEKYDLAIIDFTDPLDTSMADLYSAPFYQAVSDHLSNRGVMAVQSSTAYSDVEDEVSRNLMRATSMLPKPLRFKGKWMGDGTIVLVGKSVKQEFRMPKGYEADEPPEKPQELFWNSKHPGQELF